MATLRLEHGTILPDVGAIAHALAPLKVELHQWAVGTELALLNLLAQAHLAEGE